MAVSKDQPMRPAEVALLEAAEAFADPASYSKSGEIIETDNAADYPLLSLTIHGKSVQDGTPTPDAPVPVEVVNGKNLLDGCNGEATGDYPFNHGYNINPLQFPRTLYAGESVVFSFDAVNTVSGSLGIIFIYSDTTTQSVYTVTNGTIGRKSKQITLPKDATACGFYSSNADLTVANLQLEAGTQATAYVPYGCIGLQIGESITPIDLQGHELASLPDGTRDDAVINRLGITNIAPKIIKLILTGEETPAGGQTGNTGWGGVNTCGFYYYARYFNLPNGWTYTTRNDAIQSNILPAIYAGYNVDIEGCTLVSNADNEQQRYFALRVSRTLLTEYGSDNSTTAANINALKAYCAAMYAAGTPVTVYVPYEQDAIQLPAITPPTPIDGGTVRVVANVTPTIDVSYMASGMHGGILALNNCAADLAALDVRVTALENELDNF